MQVSAKLDPEFVAGLEAQYAAQDSQGPVSKLSARCQLLPDHTIFQGTLTPGTHQVWSILVTYWFT